MQLWGTQSTGNITLLWAVLSQCGVRLVRKCCQSPGNEKCSLRHLVTFLRHRATFKYITLWLYHHFQGPYSVPETLICTLFNTLQQPVFFFNSKVAEIPSHAKKIFFSPICHAGKLIHIIWEHVLSEFEVFGSSASACCYPCLLTYLCSH